jgi:hypothetical protein
MAALQDPDLANPIAAELTRLTDGYTSNFRAAAHDLLYSRQKINRNCRMPPFGFAYRCDLVG